MKLLARPSFRRYITTEGFSFEAKTIDVAVSPLTPGLSSVATLRGERERLLSDLCSLVDDRSNEDWDGYGAEPVSEDAFRQAYFFIEDLDDDVEMPTLGAEPDGHITMEWYRAPDRLVSVSIGPGGELTFAALDGGHPYSGSTQFTGSVPQTILALISKVTR